MDLSDIVMLEALVKHGSLSKASELLCVTQPTLSKRLSRLEYTLGTVLFERNSNGLTPTNHTTIIIERAQDIKNKMGNIERDIKLMNQLQVGELRIGVGPIVEQLYFPYVLTELTNSLDTSLNLSIRTETATDLKQLLLDGLIDIAIGPFEQSSELDDCSIFPLASQPLMTAMRAEHPLIQEYNNGRKDFSAADIFRYTLISPYIPDYMVRQFNVMEQPNAGRIICDNYAVIKEVLVGSDHITLGPAAVFSKEIKNNTIQVLDLPIPIRWYGACLTRSESSRLPLIEKILSVFRQYQLPST